MIIVDSNEESFVKVVSDVTTVLVEVDLSLMFGEDKDDTTLLKRKEEGESSSSRK